MSERIALTKKEVAERLGWSERTVERRIAAGELPVLKSGGSIRVLVKHLEAWIESRCTTATTTTTTSERQGGVVAQAIEAPTPPPQRVRVSMVDAAREAVDSQRIGTKSGRNS